ncbi:MAG: SDR family oxidoreductase [Patescibacteria group bacterium]|nr:SDR family oxidoreductase [Patescibacteria group bacterium]
MQTVLVAGGAGFIGSHLCKKLLTQEYKVICVDNLVTGSKDNLKNLREDKNFTFLEKDIIYPLGQDINADYIFHLASPASPNKKSPRSYINHPLETLLANSLGTYNLLELAKKTSAKFLYVSSSEVYGDPAVSPQKEDYFGNVNPNGVRSVYDEGKRFGEAITMNYVREYGLNARIIRIFNTYGPMMQPDDGRVVSNFITQAISKQPLTVYGNGQQTRSFCFVDDMVDGLILAMFSDKTKGEVLNLGNPDERKILEFASLIKKLTGSSSEIVFEDLPTDDPKERKPDIAKAEELIGWQPKVSIEQGLEKTVQYFKSVV